VAGIRYIILPQPCQGSLPASSWVCCGLPERRRPFFLPWRLFPTGLPHSPFDQTMALPYHLYVISTQVPGMPLRIQHGTALVLLTLVLSMNLVATIIRSYFSGEGSGRPEDPH